MSVLAVRETRNNSTAQSVFGICCWLVAVTSVADAGLAVYFKKTILQMELNPVCLCLIEMEPHGMSLFLLGKGVGTALVIYTSWWVFRIRQHMGLAVATALSLFQVGLLSYQLLA